MKLEYLRVSVTSRCNLRCTYCRGAADGSAEEAAHEPTLGELAVLVTSAAAEGVTKVRITGGEPLARADLEEIISLVAGTPGITETTLTTNGIGLASRAFPLKEAGLARVNISIDTLRPERFREMTGRGCLNEVIEGIDAATATLDGVKLNTVVTRGVNDDELGDIVRFAAERGVTVRFIERYLSADARSKEEGVSAEEIVRRLDAEFGRLETLPQKPLSIARVFGIPSLAKATVGVISSRHHPPCHECAKVRFTSNGELRSCLFASSGENIMGLLESGDGAAVRRALVRAFADKDRSGPASACVRDSVSIVGG